ncbi:GTPase-activating protein S23, partial [Bonamia ostreae]
MEFEKVEAKDGIRMSWNIWPKTKADAAKLVIPIGCLYTPLKNVTGLGKVNGHPVFCKGGHCSGILNSYCQVDFTNKIWVCPFCFMRNHFPISYNAISQQNMPPELQQNYSTIEYCIPS